MAVIHDKGFAVTVEKTDGAVLAGQDNLFDITGGPIMVTGFVGIVTDTIGAVAVTCHIDLTVVAPAADIPLSTDVSIVDDAIGTSYTFSVADPGVLTPTVAGAVLAVPRIAWLCPIGTIKAHCSAANDGNIKWYMSYVMLSQYSTVEAAA